MLGTVHVICGAALGGALGGPIGAVIGGVVSHAVLDVIPHNDRFLKSEKHLCIIDGTVITTFVLSLIAHYGWKSPFTLGAIGGVIPDLENALGIFGVLKKGQRYFPSHLPRSRGGIGHGKTRSFASQGVALASGILLFLCLILR